MDSVSRYLVHSPDGNRKVHIEAVSGGLPHSEIWGSMPIPGSPQLIAGYHVLHRLLLPRHPPNALLALDPIQRRTGNPTQASRPASKGRPFVARPRLILPAPRGCRPPIGKSYILPPHSRVRPQDIWLVYLTWIQTPPQGRPPDWPPVTPPLGRTSGSDASLSSQC